MALLGALLKVEQRAVEIQGWKNFAEWANAWGKQQKARAKRGRRR